MTLLRKTPEGLVVLAKRDGELDRIERQILILANGQRSIDELSEMMGPRAKPVIGRLMERQLLVVDAPAVAEPANHGSGTPIRVGAGAASTQVPAPSTFGSPHFRDTVMEPRELPALAEASYADNPAPLHVYAAGLSDPETQLLRAAVALSQRNRVPLQLVQDSDAQQADVVLLAGDTDALRQRLQQPWMEDLPIVWIGGSAPPEGEYVIDRPVSWVQLPRKLTDLLALTPTDTPVRQPGPRRPRVLLVDDSLAVRRYLCSVLENTGIDIIEADSGESALLAFKDDKRGFDCVLLDVIMPGVDGYDTCRVLKNTYVGERRPAIIMLTSRTSPFDRIRGKFAGCDAYLAKPVDVPKLKATLARYIHMHGADTPAVTRLATEPVFKTS